jgi:hypothetical protein
MAGKTRIGQMKESRGYLENILKEHREWRQSNPQSGPSPEAGQFWGAVFGRQYDKKGRRTK